MLNVVVMVSGGGTNLQAIIDRVEDGTVRNTKLIGVISNKPDAYALERARKAGIPDYCISPKNFAERNDFNRALLEQLEKLKPDLIVLAGYLVIVPKAVVERFAGRIINIHPSLIPSFCGDGMYGLKVHEAVLARGCKVSGATVHFVDAGTDTGPIIYQKAVEVLPGDTPEILQKRIMEQAEWVILPKAIDAIANNLL